jgi:hypothetical protein
MIEGIYVFKTNNELAVSVLKAESIKGPEYGYARVAAAMTARPTPELKGVQAVLDSIKTPKSKITSTSEVIDGSLVEEIERSGLSQSCMVNNRHRA